MRANFSPAMAISASRGALSPGRTTRTFLMSRSYAIGAVLRRSAPGSQALFEVREQATVAHDLHEERWYRLRGERLAGGAVLDATGFGVDRHVVARADALRLRADKRRQAKVDGVAVEKARVGLGNERRDTQLFERLGRLLARGTGAEVAPGDHDVPLLYRRSERRVHRFHAVPRDLVDVVFHVAARRDGVRVDVVAEHPGSHCSIPRGSVMRPVTADAATVY